MSLVWDFLGYAYLWTKTLHIISMVAWMAGLFYLPRLFVYHAERATVGTELSETFKVMEHKLLKVIINPAGVATWIFGIALVLTPGVVDWYSAWFYVKFAAVSAMTLFHHMLVRWVKTFAADANEKPGRYYRMMNEVPTLLLFLIVAMVIVKPF
ncbi:MAG: protoporphyrinogen oxidase HemJ [Pseudomonadota bacterium]